MRFNFSAIIVVLAILFLYGCRTAEESRDLAAKRAREYIFSHVRHISLQNYNYIKYIYPRILKNNLFLYRGREFNQYYFAWDLPNPKVTVLVYGTSSNDFSDWRPSRIIFKEYNNKSYKEIKETPVGWKISPSWKDQYYNLELREVNR